MEIREYDVVLLKTKQKGTILEIFDQENFPNHIHSSFPDKFYFMEKKLK